MRIRDRIKELRRVPASELLPHPTNWRTHPAKQHDALRGVLAEIGWADACLARETPDGLQLVDGHLRTEVAGDELVPVLILDLSDDEAAKVLLTLDPLAAMADADSDKLEKLLNEISVSNPAVEQMLSDLAAQHGVVPPDFEPVSEDEQGDLDKTKLVTCPHCGEEFKP